VADGSSAAHDADDFPQEFMRRHRVIDFADAVALREQLRSGARNHAVGEQPALAQIEDDIPQAGIFDAAPVDQEHVPGPNCRQHAGTGHAQAQRSEGTNRRCGQFVLRQIARVECCVHETVDARNSSDWNGTGAALR